MKYTLWTIALLAACDQQAGDVQIDPPVIAVAASTEVDMLTGVANLDDDDANGEIDWDDALPEGENDLAALDIDAEALWAGGGVLNAALAGDGVRIWADGELLLESGDTVTLTTGALEVEFRDPLDGGVLQLTSIMPGGGEAQTEVTLLAAPHLLNHHLQPAELVVAMRDSPRNNEFIEGFEEVLGDRFLSERVSQYGYDVWIQDEIELGTSSTADKRLDIVIDSIRSSRGQGLDDFPEDVFEAPDFARKTWGSGSPTSQDSFGNMEVSPPVTVDGVEYPFGRIYWGTFNGRGPRDSKLLAHLTAQGVQAPFQIDVSFLCVGHVDEITTFLPDPTAPRGFRFVIADTDAAWELLESLDPAMELPRFDEDKGIADIAEITEDAALRTLNDEIQVDYLDPALAVFTAELALEEEEIIRFPALFERNSYCGGTTAALIPGTVNMTVAQLPGEEVVHAFMPDPFLRPDDDTSEEARAEDPFIAAIEALLPASIEPHWLDDWDSYHMGLGEVHCGSNTVRTPAEDALWWEDAMHLIELPTFSGGDE